MRSERTSRAHPSTRTKSSSLSGSEMTTGGSITIPSDMSEEETTRSMTRKGTKTSIFGSWYDNSAGVYGTVVPDPGAGRKITVRVFDSAGNMASVEIPGESRKRDG